jgi:hypothetical protein
MPYRVAAGVLEHLLPVAAGTSPETLRGHTLKVGEHLRNAAPRRGSNQGNIQNEKSFYHQSSIDFRCYLELARFEPRPVPVVARLWSTSRAESRRRG